VALVVLRPMAAVAVAVVDFVHQLAQPAVADH
jgi:hypothetical protein